MIIQEINIKPTLNECFADNGAHSHWELIDSNNGKILWSESQASDNHKEIQRLKTMVSNMWHKEYATDYNWSVENQTKEWQQFKKENNL